MRIEILLFIYVIIISIDWGSEGSINWSVPYSNIRNSYLYLTVTVEWLRTIRVIQEEGRCFGMDEWWYWVWNGAEKQMALFIQKGTQGRPVEINT